MSYPLFPNIKTKSLITDNVVYTLETWIRIFNKENKKWYRVLHYDKLMLDIREASTNNVLFSNFHNSFFKKCYISLHCFELTNKLIEEMKSTNDKTVIIECNYPFDEHTRIVSQEIFKRDRNLLN